VSGAVTVGPVEPRLVAAVRRRIPRDAIGASWGPALDQVWAFLREHPELREDGHNVFLYRRDGDGMMDVAFGVEVVRGFENVGEVELVTTPEGEAASLVHVGAYSGLGAAYQRLSGAIAAMGRERAGPFWEIYGDWNDDPAKLETAIGYLLRAES